jgi:hypothetical protein
MVSHALRATLVALLAVTAIGLVPAAAVDAGAAPHAYYLFLVGAPQGCEDCYIPLLITRQPLDDVASSGRDGAVVLITTYERDSIWKVERRVPLAAVDVSAGERMVRLRGRRYRYQEIAPPLAGESGGHNAIHWVVSIPDKKALEDLVAAFRGQN